ncbi:hypothetical protein [Legionella longbeachae]|uniref:Uncharacterized protein n=1 Tax=Legionella longbeachae serogroup 1 (strain NSW150) TaxID=661367 RepID=D3HK83_LEGLN|nr:hypothetical protein [Legionella longbeachae]VEE03364.1 Uncharacterised protein [Legionella oakridgensis]HBD7397641.1 hypothetical protein [Legionella pneumophila]ARB93740.1 hypothetical protein A6J40_16850 [Legionella longbeachae]ARM33120.1 hypothetical protein B0B39_06115 [Legionella longbeachae]EEZ94039.1 conserved hypothetical protein [Legionella longbeachae D-4968]
MHPLKKQYANGVLNLLNLMCQKATENKKNVAIEEVLHISKNDANEIVKKVIIALPDSYFYNANSIMLYDMLGFISKNIFFFQAQENINDENYAYHLIGFINSLIRDISVRYYI